MKKLEYIDEATFKSEIIEFTDEHYEIAEKLHKLYEDEDNLWSKCTPIFVKSDKKSLIFCINLGDKQKDRFKYERGDNLYRIIIEKINQY